jgi:hypothetical protein
MIDRRFMILLPLRPERPAQAVSSPRCAKFDQKFPAAAMNFRSVPPARRRSKARCSRRPRDPAGASTTPAGINGKAPGISGWRGHIVRAKTLVEQRSDRFCSTEKFGRHQIDVSTPPRAVG